MFKFYRDYKGIPNIAFKQKKSKKVFKIIASAGCVISVSSILFGGYPTFEVVPDYLIASTIISILVLLGTESVLTYEEALVKIENQEKQALEMEELRKTLSQRGKHIQKNFTSVYSGIYTFSLNPTEKEYFIHNTAELKRTSENVVLKPVEDIVNVVIETVTTSVSHQSKQNIVSDTREKRGFGSTVVRGAVGGMVAGPIGLAAGVATAKKKTVKNKQVGNVSTTIKHNTVTNIYINTTNETIKLASNLPSVQALRVVQLLENSIHELNLDDEIEIIRI